MRISQASAFSTIAFFFAILFSLFLTSTGFRAAENVALRQQWFSTASALWTVGGWLWLVSIFSWMLLLVAFLWRYAPAHQVTTMLQSGLMLIAAVLAISGMVIWMEVLPVALTVEGGGGTIAVVDALARWLVGAALFMGGLTTAWIGLDLLRLENLAWPWGTGAIVAGIAVAPSPFLLPTMYHLLAGAFVWCAWCIFLATRPHEPSPYAEWL